MAPCFNYCLLWSVIFLKYETFTMLRVRDNESVSEGINGLGLYIYLEHKLYTRIECFTTYFLKYCIHFHLHVYIIMSTTLIIKKTCKSRKTLFN